VLEMSDCEQATTNEQQPGYHVVQHTLRLLVAVQASVCRRFLFSVYFVCCKQLPIFCLPLL